MCITKREREKSHKTYQQTTVINICTRYVNALNNSPLGNFKLEIFSANVFSKISLIDRALFRFHFLTFPPWRSGYVKLAIRVVVVLVLAPILFPFILAFFSFFMVGFYSFYSSFFLLLLLFNPGPGHRTGNLKMSRINSKLNLKSYIFFTYVTG